MAVILRMWRVQATLSGVTGDGWEASRQTPVMTVAARSAADAANQVIGLAVDFTSRSHLPGRKVAMSSVVEVAKDGLPIGDPSWVRTTYAAGGIETVSAATFDAIRHIKDFNPYDE